MSTNGNLNQSEGQHSDSDDAEAVARRYDAERLVAYHLIMQARSGRIDEMWNQIAKYWLDGMYG